MDLEGIPEELKAKARACQTPEELVKLAESEGYELTEADIEAIANDSWNCYEEGGCNVVCLAGSSRPTENKEGGKVGFM